MWSYLVIILSVIVITITMYWLFDEIDKTNFISQMYIFYNKPFIFNYKGVDFKVEVKNGQSGYPLYVHKVLINDEVVAIIYKLEHTFLKSREIYLDNKHNKDETKEIIAKAKKEWNKQFYVDIDKNMKEKSYFNNKK